MRRRTELNCQETQELLDAYADDELELVKSLEVEQHFQDCQVCSRMYQNQRTLRTAINADSLYYKAPANLRKRVRLALVKTEGVGLFPRMPTWGWQGAGIALTLIAIISLSLVSLLKSPSAEDLLAQEIISSHVRSLMAAHLTDVLSSDQHTVKPWFEGKLNFSPQVTDLTRQGFTLVGGRLDYVANKPVAALVYQRRKHFINLYVWLSAIGQNAAAKTCTRQGYNLVHWTKSDMTYWAVSDIAITELEEFAQVIQNPS